MRWLLHASAACLLLTSLPARAQPDEDPRLPEYAGNLGAALLVLEPKVSGLSSRARLGPGRSAFRWRPYLGAAPGHHVTARGAAGLAIRVAGSLSLVPAYRYLRLEDDADFRGDHAHVLRLEARIRF